MTMMKMTKKKSLQVSMLSRVLAALAVLFVALWYPVVWVIVSAKHIALVADNLPMTFDTTMSIIIAFVLTLVIYRGILPIIIE